jgi:hypothetical protein
VIEGYSEITDMDCTEVKFVSIILANTKIGTKGAFYLLLITKGGRRIPSLKIGNRTASIKEIAASDNGK